MLKTNILQMAATLMACGIDPSKALLFQQSKVSNILFAGFPDFCTLLILDNACPWVFSHLTLSLPVQPSHI